VIEKNLNNEFDSLFKEGLENTAVTPPNGLWDNLSSQIGNPVVSSTITQTIITKTSAIWIKTSLMVAVVTASVTIAYYISKPNKEQAANDVIQNEAIVSPNTDHKTFETDIDNPLSSPQNTSFEKTAENKSKSIQKNPLSLSNQEKNHSLDPLHDNKSLDKRPSDIHSKNDHLIEDPKPKIHQKTTDLNDKSESDDQNETEPEIFIPIKKDTIFKFIPNVVTPNNDGFNDVYFIDIKGETSFYISIFNERMERVFESNNKNKGWECKLPNGEDAPVGNYIVIVKYQLKNDIEKTEKTILKLIR
jgi:gliding motility-associated-like protein